MTAFACAFRFSSLPIALSLTSLIFGCSSAPVSQDGLTGATQSVEETTAANETGQKLLYTITIEDGHTIGFYELAAGVAVVTETAHMGQAPVLAKAGASGAQSLAANYRFFRPTDEVPAVIVAADARLAAFTPPLVAGAPPPASAPAPALAPAKAGGGPKLYTASQQTWFSQTFCTNSSTLTLFGCYQGVDSVTTGWRVEGEFYATAFNGSEDTGPAAFSLHYWTGGSVGVGSNGNWQSQLAPGYYQSVEGLHIGSPYYIWVSDIETEYSATYLDIAGLGCGESGQDSCVSSCGTHGCDQGLQCEAYSGYPNGVCYCGSACEI